MLAGGVEQLVLLPVSEIEHCSAVHLALTRARALHVTLRSVTSESECARKLLIVRESVRYRFRITLRREKRACAGGGDGNSRYADLSPIEPL